MLTSRNQFVVAGLTAGLLAVGGVAQASSITQSFNIPTQTPSFTQNIDYNLFNSSLGTLTSVTLQLVVNGSATVTVFNLSPTTAEAFTTATTSFPLTVTGPPGVTTFITGANLNATQTGGTVNPLTENQYPGTTAHFDSGVINVPNTDWGSYEAPGGGLSGTDLVFASGASTSGGSGGADLLYGGSGTVGDPSSFLTLIYNYQPPSTPGTPEPGAWALLVASASVSFAGLRRRRIAK